MLKAQAADGELFHIGREFIIRSDMHNYAYQWTWCGLPIIQMPQDVLAIQQIMWKHRPSVVIETGVAWGGGVALYASLMDLYGGRLVVGIDLNLTPTVVNAVEALEFQTEVVLLRGSSIDPTLLAQIRALIGGSDQVMVVLDSSHTHEHVLAELETYHSMVSPGQYLIVTDTIIESVPPPLHRPRPWGPGRNPKTALDAFLQVSQDFTVDKEIDQQLVMSFSPSGYLRRRV